MRTKKRPRAVRQPRQFISTKAVVDGIEFDSKTEAAFYQHLKRNPSVKLIEVQPEFQIIAQYKVACKRCAGTGKRPSPKTGILSIVLCARVGASG
jgi:hypothetical protein